MLKIVDNYDLDKLKKYKFKKNGWWYDFQMQKDNENMDLYVSAKNRFIYCEPDFESGMETQEQIFDVLFDMIKDGIVEKVNGSSKL